MTAHGRHSDGAPDAGMLSDNSAAPARWYAVHTRSRHEKAVHAQLLRADVEAFLPMREERRRWADRWKNVLLPMFPGYLFVHSSVEDLEVVWATKGVVSVLGRGRDKPTPVEDDQVLRVRALVDKRVQVQPAHTVKEGALVRVFRGPLMGLSGELVRIRGKDRLMIKVDLIGKGVMTDVHAGDVEPI